MNKEHMLKILEEECRESDLPLKEKAKSLVFGKGNSEAEILFVGEAPGRNEDEQGIPFVGAAGKNLDKLLSEVGLSLKNVYITNILKYRPPENREPSIEEISSHTPFLLRQISIMKPRVVCSLGSYSTKFFFANGDVNKMDEQPNISKVHGVAKIVSINGIKIRLVPLFHPAAIIYNKKLIIEWEKDMEIVKKEIGQKILF